MTWHDDGTPPKEIIPANEVWLKIRGDKGGGSFKMSTQIANVRHPNSPLNTLVFCAFEAPDTTTNLHIGLDRHRQKVDKMKTIPVTPSPIIDKRN